MTCTNLHNDPHKNCNLCNLQEIADRQHKKGLHGAMLWFEVKGGTAAGRALMDSIQRPWSLCENLGAVESICELRPAQ